MRAIGNIDSICARPARRCGMQEHPAPVRLPADPGPILPTRNLVEARGRAQRPASKAAAWPPGSFVSIACSIAPPGPMT